ncbi:propionyl-CoA ligase domain-containing protein [Rhizobium sp. N621]|nr:propionyl-CoA ligase domain-containing protein [Rhizobium sp. N621]ANL05884.1 propionyl-CoA ligase domain-containing protein [Rhizobium esperanzae]
MQNGYRQVYAAWKQDPEGFWREAAADIDWFKPPERIFSPGEGVYGRWFSEAETNTCYNCLDRHAAAGRGGEMAILFDSAMTGEKRRFTYDEALGEVKAIAAALLELGIGKGDRVILYMPMVPEAVFSMLACARIGAVHSVVFGGFAASELAARIDDSGAKLVITASCGLEPGRTVAYKPLVDQAIELARMKPERCLVLQRPQLQAELAGGRDQDFEAAVARHRGAEVACVPVKSTDPLYILYTSGTTGQPKGVVRDNGGHMVALNWSMRNIYGLKPGEVFWTASDIGWVVGHSYIVYAPLIAGVTTLIYEGKPVGTPDAGVFWRIVSEYKVRVLFTAPTAFRVIRREDGEGELLRQYTMPDFRALFLAGERADQMGGAHARRAGHRSLVADGDRLADRRQSARSWCPPRQAWLTDIADARL